MSGQDNPVSPISGETEQVPRAELERIRRGWITAGGGDLARSMEYQVLRLVAPGLLAAVEDMLRSRVGRAEQS